MRYVVVLLVSFIALTWAPGLVSAQGLFGCSDVGSSGGLPILGKLFGKKNKAVSCFDDPPRGGGLAFYAGYLTGRDGVSFTYSPRDEFVLANDVTQEMRYPLSGVLLAASGSIPVTERLAILLNGSWLIQSGGEEMHQVFNRGRAGWQWEATWDVKTEWWNAGAAAAFNVAGPFSAIGGFLADSFTTNFSDPSNIIRLWTTSADEGDLTVHTIAPYLGGLVTQGGPAGSLTIGMIGFPLLFGNAKYTQSGSLNSLWELELSGAVTSGYFFEIFAETSVNIRAVSFGIFAGWNTVQARMDMDYYSGRRPAGGGALATYSQAYAGGFYRSAWVLGGKFALDFVSPF